MTPTLIPEVALDDSAFKPVWDVIQALRAHDEDLGEQLDALRRELGRRGGIPKLPDKIHFDLPVNVGADFAEAFDVFLVERTTASWEFWFGLLDKFIGKHRHALIPAKLVVDGYKLGSWVNLQRTRYMEGSLEQDRIDRLEAVPGWTWDARAEIWAEGFQRLREYVAEHGDARVPTSFVLGGFRLGQWVSVQRVNFNKGNLTEDRKNRLEELPGWSWHAKADLWEDGFHRLQRYVERNGDTLPRQSYVDDDGYRVGSWVNTQRQTHAEGCLQPDRVRRLEELSCWSWNSLEDKWEEGFRRLLQYVKKHRKARVSQRYELDGYRLGSWVTTQRVAYHRANLSAEQQRRLEDLPGWSWSLRADEWEEHYVQLLDYIKQYGTSRVPQQYKVEGFRLGGWVQKQRNDFAAGKLSADRQRRLEKLSEWRWSRWDS